MSKRVPKLYRVQFLITKPTEKNVRITGVSKVHFCLAESEQQVQDHVNTVLEEIRKLNNNDSTIYVKNLKIEKLRFDGVFNFINN